jgi:hypothetical protein
METSEIRRRILCIISHMGTPDNAAEYDALQRRAQELRKELGLDRQLDKVELLRSEVQTLEVLKDIRVRLQTLEENEKAREKRNKNKEDGGKT